MFKILNNEKQKFKQWSVDQKLVCKECDVDTVLYITNDIHTVNPLKVKTYEFEVENEDGGTETVVVCDVPNILLTMNNNICVSVNGCDWLGGFEIDPCAKPADYIYTETATAGGGNAEPVTPESIGAFNAAKQMLMFITSTPAPSNGTSWTHEILAYRVDASKLGVGSMLLDSDGNLYHYDMLAGQSIYLTKMFNLKDVIGNA